MLDILVTGIVIDGGDGITAGIGQRYNDRYLLLLSAAISG